MTTSLVCRVPRVTKIFGARASMANFDAKTIIKDKKFWFASLLIVWAAGLQGHMMWLQKQDSFKQKFGTIDSAGEGSHE
ncbi:PREDICTED: uncharacterized protein LOC104824262 [Tarenaya hassleriana]|uniref:uncharacterized protein LOC104824262 n=1 Tax=Tarenaya hassleriana TaxID=28532 RepID=UPI00053C1E67|nr:PREDICTED: uncharacterized protein LOC104824262 [Tarenaya hassleriana]